MTSGIEWKKDICRACFHISAEKPKQKLTTRNSAKGDDNTPEQQETFSCLKCALKFTGISVARLPHTRWCEVRNRPLIGYHQQHKMCRVKKRNECELGTKCKYAHNTVELAVWAQQKQDNLVRKPPSIPAEDYKICMKQGHCEADWQCLYAHSEMELDSWNQIQDHMEFPRQSAQPHKDPKCHKLCHFISSNRRCQAGMSCNFAHSQEELELWKKGPPVRPCPRIPPLKGEYRLCYAVSKGKRCLYGGKCIFAHSQKELNDWNAKHQTTVIEPQPSGDFASVLRSKVSGIPKYREQQELNEKLAITLVSETPVNSTLALTSCKKPEWKFKLTAKASVKLHSVVLKDIRTTDFTIDGIFKPNGQPVQSVSQAKSGKGQLIKQGMTVGDVIFVKIRVKPRFGVLKQTVIFDLGEIHWTEELNVSVVKNKEDEDHFHMTHNLDSTPEMSLPRERLRDYRSNISALPQHFFKEEADIKLPEYTLPSTVSSDDFRKKFTGVELNKVNYEHKMKALLMLEEQCQNENMDRYSLYDKELKPRKEFTAPISGLECAPDGYYFVEVSVDEVLFEGRRSIKSGDGAYLKPKQSETIYECKVHRVQESSVVLVIPGNAKEACIASSGVCCVEFFIARVHMRTMYHAIKSVDVNMIFPQAPGQRLLDMNDEHNASLNDKIDSLKLDDSQTSAVVNILSSTFKQIPTIILGPFGCGKTHTNVQCIKLLAQDTKNKVLICTRSNSAADIYVEMLHEEFKEQPTDLCLLRLNYSLRNFWTVSSTAMKYSRQCSNTGNFEIPTLVEIQSYQIVVSTLSTSRLLKLSELEKGHFPYIFIDEAAQVLETECIIPLSLADTRTKLVIAGDYMQIEPPVFSETAKEYGLKKSLLERLHDHAEYSTEMGQLCKVVLTANYRSHPQITELLAKMFYEEIYQKDITATRDATPESRVKFVNVPGTESKEVDSPSLFNLHEALVIAEKIQQLVTDDAGVKPEDICVLTVYSKQVQMIRHILRCNHFKRVLVHSVENVQGNQFPVVIISTVRTCSSSPELGDTDQFLNNPKLLNTAMSRAQEQVIVVGNQATLCSVGANREYWNQFIRECHAVCDKSETYLRNGDLTPEEMQAEYPAQKQQNEETLTPKQTRSLRPLNWIPKEGLEILNEKELGRGSYGCVKKVRYEEKTYAAKIFRDDAYVADDKLFEKFLVEAKILSDICHQNIVQYVGITYISGPILVMELLVSNLHKYLEDKPKLSIPQILRILHDISQVLAYLHDCKVIHRDLTAKNVLLDGKSVAKISDFGNSCIANIDLSSQLETMTGYPGTRVYCAPETHESSAKYNNKIDVFSFGHLSIFVVIEEFPSTLLARVEEDTDGKLILHTEIERRGIYIERVIKRLGESHDIVLLIKKCLEYSPRKRPYASEVETILSKLHREEKANRPASDSENTSTDKEKQELRELIL